MEEKKSKQCLTAMLKKFNSLDNQISRIKDQLDDLYHNGIDGWKESIKIIKDKYPKG